MTQIISVTVLVIGAGPAGTQCAMALDNQGIKTAIINKQKIAGGLQNTNPYITEWVAVSYKEDGSSLSEKMEKNLDRESLLYFPQSEITLITEATHQENSEKKLVATMQNNNGIQTIIYADYIVLAMGVSPKKGELEPKGNFLFGPGKQINSTDFSGKRVAILGGGDNAFENFTFIQGKNPEQIDLYAKKIVARADLTKNVPQENVHVKAFTVNQSANKVDDVEYDIFCIFYGWEVNFIPMDSIVLECNHKKRYRVDSVCRTSHHKIFAIGEVNHHAYPSIVQSMSEGMMVSKIIAHELIQNNQIF